MPPKKPKLDATLRGPALVALAIEAFAIRKPRPLDAQTLDALTLGGVPLPPSMRTWLAHHGALPKPAATRAMPEALATAPWSELGRHALGRSGLHGAAPPPLAHGVFLPLDVGDEQFRALFAGTPDEHGELPVLDVDADAVTFVALALPGFDVWLAVAAGLVPVAKARALYRDALAWHRDHNVGGAEAWERRGAWVPHVAHAWEPPRMLRIERKKGPPDPATELVEAVRDGDLASVRELLDEGLDPNGADRVGRMPLLHAASCAHPEIVALLLARGAAPDAADPAMKTTPLAFVADVDWWHYADAAPQNLDRWVRCLRALAAGGADPNASVQWESRPILLAARRRSIALVATLLELGADPCAVHPVLGSALHVLLAKPGGRRTQPARDVVACLALLLARGVDPTLVRADGETALHVAAADPGTPKEVFEMLLAHGARGDATNAQGLTWHAVRGR